MTAAPIYVDGILMVGGDKRKALEEVSVWSDRQAADLDEPRAGRCWIMLCPQWELTILGERQNASDDGCK